MLLRIAQLDDIETLFDIRTSVVENYQSRREIAALGITPASVAEMLQTDCCAWIAVREGEDIGFAIANKTEKNILGMFVRPTFEGLGAGRLLMQAAEHWLWSHHRGEISLITGNDPTFRAYGFYLHLGWIPTDVQTDGDFAGEIKFVKRP